MGLFRWNSSLFHYGNGYWRETENLKTCGLCLSEHTSPFDALVQVLDGEAKVFIEGEANDVKAGEIVIMPAGRPHSLQADVRFKMMLVMIRCQ